MGTTLAHFSELGDLLESGGNQKEELEDTVIASVESLSGALAPAVSNLTRTGLPAVLEQVAWRAESREAPQCLRTRHRVQYPWPQFTRMLLKNSHNKRGCFCHSCGEQTPEIKVVL